MVEEGRPSVIQVCLRASVGLIRSFGFHLRNCSIKLRKLGS